MSTYSSLYGVCNRNKKILMVLVLLTFMAEVSAAIAPLYLGMFIDQIDTSTVTTLMRFIAITILAQYLTKCFRIQLAHRDLSKFTLDTYKEIRVDTMKSIFKWSVGQHRNSNSGKLISEVRKGEDAILPLIKTILYELLPVVITYLVISSIMLVNFPRIAILYIIYVPIQGYILYRIGKRYYPKAMELEKKDNEISKRRVEGIRHTAMLQVNNAEGQAIDRYDKEATELVSEERSFWLPYITTTSLSNISILFVGAVFVYFIFLIDAGIYTKGALFTCYLWGNRITNGVDKFPRLVRSIGEFLVKVKKYQEVINIETNIKNGETNMNGTPVKEISMENVSFNYDDQGNLEDPVINDVSLSIKQGQFIGLVGESGSGKSTLFNLLIRGNDPSSGIVKLNGIDIREFDISSFRRKLGYVEQNIAIVDASLRENLLYGAENPDEYTDEQLAKVLQDVRLGQFKDCLGRQVGEDGMKLAGGERLRVGIARALIRDPEVLLLDEATSQLDTITEGAIRDILRDEKSKRTIIMIAHRLCTVVDADVIYVLDKGKILKSGTHGELIKTCPKYRSMVEASHVPMS